MMYLQDSTLYLDTEFHFGYPILAAIKNQNRTKNRVFHHGAHFLRWHNFFRKKPKKTDFLPLAYWANSTHKCNTQQHSVLSEAISQNISHGVL